MIVRVIKVVSGDSEGEVVTGYSEGGVVTGDCEGGVVTGLVILRAEW